MSGHSLPGGLNHGATFSLAKNLEDDSLRRKEQRRPDRYSWAILITIVSPRCCAGFIKGRSMLDNIVLIESNLLEHAVFRGAERAGLFLSDFAAASPSLAHAWILAVVQHMLIPEYVVDAVQQLYRDIYTSIRLGGGTFRGYHITRGIKQGCPLSGVLFALAADPIFRCMY
eukprot:3333926-Pyramimonas_sp.AAC.1